MSSDSRSDSSKARWLTLRQAFVSAVAAANGRKDGTTSQSGRQREKRFDGFKLFPRHEEEEGPLLRSGEGDVLATYQLPDGSEVKTREASLDGARERAVVTLAQIFSHCVHGVDNTGNVCVWPSEKVLLHALLTGPLAPSLRGARVLELGAGKCGLAGLGVAVGSEAAEVVITDGNPDAVENLQACVELNEKGEKEKGGFGATKVLARRLVWDRLDRDGSRAELLKSCGNGGFDLVIASDCLFFKDFHDDLRSTIAHLLAPRGRAILVQPQRGGTVDLFLRCVYAAAAPPPSAPDLSKASATSPGASNGKGCAAEEADGDADLGEAACPCPCSHHEPPLDARLVRRFDERAWDMHLDYARRESLSDGGNEEADRGYVPDRHLPLLVELCRRTPEEKERGEDDSSATSDNDLFWTRWPENLPSAAEEGNCAMPESGAGGIDQKTAAGAQAEVEYSVGAEARKDSRPRRSDARVAPGDPAVVSIPSLGDRHPTGPVPCSAPAAVVAAAAAANGSDDRPDRQMDAVYKDLARRLIEKVRDGRKKRGQQGGGVEERTEGRPAPEQGRQLWVAIAGAPGSGKTTLAAEVCRHVQEVYPAVCMPMDGFHFYRRELDAMPDPAEAHRRRGAHWTFDGERFLREVEAARSSGRGSFPGFDHVVGDPIENAWQVHPFHEVVIMEGNYLLLKGVDPWDKASGLFDEVWAVRCPPEVCGERVRKRHIKTGLSDSEARLRVQTNDLPNARLIQDLCPWGEVDVVIDSL